MSTHSQFPVRRMPRLPKWPQIVVLVVFAALVAVVIYFDWWFTLLPLVAAIFLAVYFEHRIRCPQCQSRVQPRDEKSKENPGAWQRFYDCPRCQVTWDPGVTTYEAT